MSETCWVHKKWNKIASDIKLVFYFSTHLLSLPHLHLGTSCDLLLLLLFSLFLHYRTYVISGISTREVPQENFAVLVTYFLFILQISALKVLLTYLLNYLLTYLLTYLFTYSMVQSPSWEANWFAASQEILHISRNPKVHYRTHKRPPPVSILGQPNPVHIPTSHLSEFRPNIIHPSTSRSPQSTDLITVRYLTSFVFREFLSKFRDTPRTSEFPMTRYDDDDDNDDNSIR